MDSVKELLRCTNGSGTAINVWMLLKNQKGSDLLMVGPFLNLGVPTGIRTPVHTVKGYCPRPLDDRDLSCGGGKRDRTADLLHAMQALSQLSYTPTRERALYE
jgi:hypothetical protein